MEINQKNINKCIQKLHSLYNKIPSTVGCMENIGKCKSYCCFLQTPQVFYVEFLNLWRFMLKNWSLDQVLNVIKKSVRCYLSSNPVKGCILFDEEAKTCICHSGRCFNCRIYGITPKEEFEPRYQKMKELYKDKPGVIIRNQCNLVKTESGIEVTTKDTDIWWEKLIDIEEELGVKRKNIHDNIGGSYRTYHDHILMYVLNEDLLAKMTQIRLLKCISEDERNQCVESFMICLTNIISGIMNAEKENTDT